MQTWCADWMCDDLNEHSSDAYVNDCEGDYIDEVTEVTLLRDDVVRAGAEEMAWYEKFQTYEEVTDETCVQELDANQSLVDGEISTKATMNVWKYEADWSHVKSNIGTDSYFAGTPMSALVRYVIRRAATRLKTGKRRQLMVLDAKTSGS